MSLIKNLSSKDDKALQFTKASVNDQDELEENVQEKSQK